MQIAMLAAGFSAGEADALRRAMAAWRRRGDLGGFRERLIEGMTRRGYEAAFAEAIFRQIQGFGEYGFPESHAASFALLVYVSAWIKCHEPAAFLAGLLDSQPMGFYAPAQLVRDARAHGVEVLGVDVLDSDWGCTLEARGQSQPAVRLGLQQVRGLSRSAGERLLAARKARRRQRPERPAFDDTDDLARAAGLDAHALRCLADANALVALAGHRRQAAWEVAAVASAPALLADAPVHEPRTKLAAPSDGEDTVADYRSLGIPMGRHPLELLRPRLARWSLETAAALLRMPDRRTVMAAGLVTHRQRPETAGGTLFVTLEDETGAIDLIVRPRVFERHRNALLSARLLRVRGMLQRSNDGAGSIAQLIAWQLFDDSALLGSLVTVSRDFR